MRIDNTEVIEYSSEMFRVSRNEFIKTELMRYKYIIIFQLIKHSSEHYLFFINLLIIIGRDTVPLKLGFIN